MKVSPQVSAILLATLSIWTRAAVAAPPNIVTSQGGNTAMGTGALESLVPWEVPLTFGIDNTAAGAGALGLEFNGTQNSAFGAGALTGDVSGIGNTAVGYLAISSGEGNLNTAVGFRAMFFNENSTHNSAFGALSIGGGVKPGGMTGSDVTALGYATLQNDTTGYNNTAVGSMVLNSNTVGFDNTAMGNESLRYNVTGYANTANGVSVMRNLTSGSRNTGMGYSACWSCRTGNDNVAIGRSTLHSNFSGSNNIALGASAGYSITGSHNIDIGNVGMSADGNTIRIGAPSTQTSVYIAGITATPVTGAAVYVTADGQLGVLASSERYKTSINTMRNESEKLQELRPVTFHLKNETKGALQYGLIAEEVDKVYPALVLRDASGKIQGVRYDELPTLLLKQLQDQGKIIREQSAKLRSQAADLAALKQRLSALEKENGDARVARVSSPQ